jgi:hypothetical protein
MVVWIFHARVGHRQGLYPKNAFPSGKAFCFGRRGHRNRPSSPLAASLTSSSRRRPGPSAVTRHGPKCWVIRFAPFGAILRMASALYASSGLRRVCACAHSTRNSAKHQLLRINCDTMLFLPNHCKVRPNERNQGSLITYDASPGQLDRRIRRGEEPCSSMLRPGVSRACIGRQDC